MGSYCGPASGSREPLDKCVEPVSHVPDAINRPGLAAAQEMIVLEPGGKMTGAIRFSVMSRCASPAKADPLQRFSAGRMKASQSTGNRLPIYNVLPYRPTQQGKQGVG